MPLTLHMPRTTQAADSQAQLEVEFDNKVIRLSAVKKAAYQLSSLMTLDIAVISERIVCKIIPREASEIAASDLMHTLRTAVLDYDLREQIGEETRSIRNAILAAAFAPLTSKLQQ